MKLQIKNETHIAAELTMVSKRPYAVAWDATILCSLGRTYMRLSKRMCNEPDVGDKIAAKRHAIMSKVDRILDSYKHSKVMVTGDGLGLKIRTTLANYLNFTTVLQ